MLRVVQDSDQGNTTTRFISSGAVWARRVQARHEVVLATPGCDQQEAGGASGASTIGAEKKEGIAARAPNGSAVKDGGGGTRASTTGAEKKEGIAAWAANGSAVRCAVKDGGGGTSAIS